MRTLILETYFGGFASAARRCASYSSKTAGGAFFSGIRDELSEESHLLLAVRHEEELVARLIIDEIPHREPRAGRAEAREREEAREKMLPDAEVQEASLVLGRMSGEFLDDRRAEESRALPHRRLLLDAAEHLHVPDPARRRAALENEAVDDRERIEERSGEARHPSVMSAPVEGWRSLSPSGPETTRIGSRGTPSPISTSAQTGTKSTCGMRAFTTSDETLRPL